MDMASSGNYYPPYYYPPAPYHYNYYSQQQARGGGHSSFPVFLFLVTVSLLAATTLVAWCESAVESLVDQLRPLLILSPLLVIIAVQLWMASGGGVTSLLSELVAGDQRRQYYYGYGGRGGGGAGSSPWGVALALVLVLFLVSFQSSIHERWFGR